MIDYKKYPEKKYIKKIIKKFNLKSENFAFDKKNFVISLNLCYILLKRIPKDIRFFTKLKELNLSMTSIRKIEGLDELSRLEKLYMGGNSINKIEGLEKLNNLITLDLNNNKINIIEGFDNLAKLEILWLYKNEIKKIENLRNLPNLQELNLGWNQITQIEGLENLSRLERLHINNNHLSKIQGIENLAQLKVLNFRGNKIRKIQGLSKNLELKHLYLKSNRITKIGGLMGLVKLDQLELEDNSLSEEHEKIYNRGIGAIHEVFIEKNEGILDKEQSIDILILTPMILELKPIINRLENVEEIAQFGEYIVNFGEITNFNGQKIRIAIYSLPEYGNISASTLTTKFLNKFKPKIFIVCGIAGGLKERFSHLQLGDIIVADQIIYYEIQKEQNGNIDYRPRVYPASSWVRQRLRSYFEGTNPNWTDEITISRPKENKNIQTCHWAYSIASGEKISGDPESNLRKYLSEELKSLKIAGVEMESAGAAYPILRGITEVRPEILVVRAISDFGDTYKKPDHDKKWQPYAADVVGAFLLHSIKTLDFTDSKVAKKELKIELSEQLKTLELNDKHPDYIDYRRVEDVYVKPEGYQSMIEKLLKNRFLLISGPANIGKTATAMYLAFDIKQKNKNINQLFFIKPSSNIDYNAFRNAIIIFDDYFGSTTLDLSKGDKFRRILNISNPIFNNYVILTTRVEILESVKRRRTRFAEYPKSKIDDLSVVLEVEKSYSDNHLYQILENHLKYYFKKKTIDKKEYNYANEVKNDIIHNLRFPHNYKEFVEEELKKVLTDKLTLHKAIENAKYIKRTVKNWFCDFNFNERVLLLTLCFIPNLSLTYFQDFYLRIINKLLEKYSQLKRINIKHFLKRTKPYFELRGEKIIYGHVQYWEGIFEAIFEHYFDDVVFLIPLFEDLFLEVEVPTREIISYIFGKIGKENFELISPTLERIMQNEDPMVVPSIISNILFILYVTGVKQINKTSPFFKKAIKKRESYELTINLLREFAIYEPQKILSLFQEIFEDPENTSYCIRTGIEWKEVQNAIIESIIEIGKMHFNDVKPLLIDFLHNKESFVRIITANRLGKLGQSFPEEVINLLKIVILDENPHVRGAVIEALIEIGKKYFEKVYPLLTEFIKDRYYPIKNYLVCNLIELKDVKNPKLKKLFEILRNDEELCDMATEIYEEIFNEDKTIS